MVQGKRRVLAFGTFDGIHPGHRFFLTHARRLGEHLTVSVARDAHVRALKNKEPTHDEDTRLEAIRTIDVVDHAVLSDASLGTYGVVNRIRPDIIAIGHDQNGLFGDLNRWMQQNNRHIPTERIPEQPSS